MAWFFFCPVNHLSSHAAVLLNESFAATNEREGSEIARQSVKALLEKRIKIFFIQIHHAKLIFTIDRLKYAFSALDNEVFTDYYFIVDREIMTTQP